MSTPLKKLIKSARANRVQYIAADVKCTCPEDLKINIYAIKHIYYDDVVLGAIAQKLIYVIKRENLDIKTILNLCQSAPDYFKSPYVEVNIQPGYTRAQHDNGVKDFKFPDSPKDGESQAIFIVDNDNAYLLANGAEALISLLLAMLTIYLYRSGKYNYMNLVSRLTVNSLF